MCGIAGFFDAYARVGARDASCKTLASMASRLVHRGPDDEGVTFDEATRVGLAFRRLSILDLSPAGHQPMRSTSGRFEIAFNGEVYNHAQLRDELTAIGHSWRGHSDTEVMLAAFEAWGVERAIARFTGMFAIALLDRTERVLWLVRDRFGVKPLYYGVSDGVAIGDGDFTLAPPALLAWSSELKALRALAPMQFTVDRGALTLYMRHGYVPSPLSIFSEVRKLRAGHLLRVDLATRRVEDRCWWSSRERVLLGAQQPFTGSDEDAVNAVDHALLESVRLRMLADVPLGAFLSGGIDSTAVVAAMQSLSSSRIKTFTIGFHQRALDEAPYARAVAAHLGTDHTEVYVSGDDALAIVPRLAQMWDEPFADSSQIPTALVCSIARRDVTVALSGDGGDELFGGYYRYSWTHAIIARTRRLPTAARTALAAVLRATPRRLTNRAGTALSAFFPARFGFDRAGDRAHKLAQLLHHRDAWSIYLDLIATCNDPAALVQHANFPRTSITDPAELCSSLDLTTRMMQADIVSYLVDDILVKVDRASMATSLEAREPLLDHHLAELAFSLPMHMKIRAGERKWVLNRVVERRVPRALMNRPKMGFGVPLTAWMRGPLREWADALVDPTRLAREGFLHPTAVHALWNATLAPNARGNGAEAWNILMFQAWLEEWSK